METPFSALSNLLPAIIIGLLAAVIAIFIYLRIKKALNSSAPATSPYKNSNKAQDFTAFEESDRFSTNSVNSTNEEEDDDDDKIAGDVSRLEEFIRKLIAASEDAVDDIQINQASNNDLLLDLLKDEENINFLLEAYLPADQDIDVKSWIAKMQSVTDALRLKVSSISEEDEIFTILLGQVAATSVSECKQVIEKVLLNGYGLRLDSSVKLEYCRY